MGADHHLAGKVLSFNVFPLIQKEMLQFRNLVLKLFTTGHQWSRSIHANYCSVSVQWFGVKGSKHGVTLPFSLQGEMERGRIHIIH